MLEKIAYNWFLIYYFALGLIFFIQGMVWFRRPESFTEMLTISAEKDQKPKIVLKAIRYFVIFTCISAFLSFFPFSVFELGFSLFCLFLIYVSASFLVKWDAIKPIILSKPSEITDITRKLGKSLIMLAVMCFALSYRFLLFHS